ncbi:MAG: RusA family crossover junction endodeoxyribonuclease [Nanoarchaeota archaeon]
MIVIPIKPISTNKLFQGRRFKTKDYDAFINAALYFAPKLQMTKGLVSLKIDFYVQNEKRSDLDNFLKGSLDLIVKAGYIEDDRFIYKIIARKFAADKTQERIELKIKPLKGSDKRFMEN